MTQITARLNLTTIADRVLLAATCLPAFGAPPGRLDEGSVRYAEATVNMFADLLDLDPRAAVDAATAIAGIRPNPIEVTVQDDAPAPFAGLHALPPCEGGEE